MSLIYIEIAFYIRWCQCELFFVISMSNSKGDLMASGKIMFLHLSDIHLRSESDEILKRTNEIASATFHRLHEVQTLAIVLSGDIAWSGLAVEYKLAERFIEELRQIISAEAPSVKTEVFICAGNHDCDFSLNDDTRASVLGTIRTLNDTLPSDSLIKTASAIQEEFFIFRDKVSQHKWEHNNRLSWQTTIHVGSDLVGIRCLNVAWMSEIKEKQGTLVFPSDALVPFAFGKHAGLTVTLLHHPFNWFGQATYRNFQSAVRHQSQLIFTGHEHFPNIGEVTDLRSSPSIFIEGGVLFENNAPQYSTFNIVTVDLKDEQYMAELYNWNGVRYLPDVDNEEWGSLRALPVKKRQDLELNVDFATLLNDPGANFSHSGKKNLVINDFFVWPELRCIDDPGLIKKQVSAAHLEDINQLNCGAFIRGEEKSGKSTLLRQYFSSYYERGYLPLYFRASWFKKSHQIEPLKAIRFALEKQYKKTSHQSWFQESKSQKVLLLDDGDSSALPPELFSNCLSSLSEYFSAVIVTAKDGASALDLLSIERVDALAHFTQYEIREFGNKKRFELVCKWAEIGGHENESSEKWMHTIDKWEKDLTTALGHQFVPSVPIFLLTLLQSIESGRTVDLQNSSFGHYYQFLVTSALQNIGIEREQWAEIINYCANLAWFIHSSEQKYVTENGLANFNHAFSKEFTSVLFERRMRELIEAGILASIDGEIKFKYPYLLYYFLGQYLADRIHEPEVEQYIVNMCDDLHLRDNANILLFTSHHTKSPIIYERIAAALERCFEDEIAFDFERDALLLNNLIDSAPQLIYHEEPVKETRSKVRENQDRANDAKQDMSDDAKDGAYEQGTNTAASITRLFRGMEILGQFLKNHYGTTKNPVKEELLDNLLQSALRGLHGITRWIIQDTDVIARHVERILAERAPGMSEKELEARSKRLVFDFISMITYAFIQKAGAAVGSAYLKNNLKNVVERNGTLGYSLIEMCYQMDLPERIPFADLKELNKAVGNNIFSLALLRTMALKHLHLFPVSYKDKQRLCEVLDIGLRKQLALQHDRTTHESGHRPH